MPTHDPARLLDIGARLRSLREEGVLVIGSGFMTHGLPFLTREMFAGNAVPAWSSDFDHWAADALARGDVDTLAAYRGQGPRHALRAPDRRALHAAVHHPGRGRPSAEQPVQTTIEGYQFGLSKRSFQVA